MPELPEVRTVASTLKKQILNTKIIDIKVLCLKMIEPDSLDINLIKNQKLEDIYTIGKYLIFKFEKLYLVSHLRMEGKYFVKKQTDEIVKHEHVIFTLNNGMSLRYHDTRKFGKMMVCKNLKDYQSLNKLGLEPFDQKMKKEYLLNSFKNKTIPIKEALLDQTIICGLGNIYASEVLYAAKINPLKKCKDLSLAECESIIKNSKSILNKSIKYGGTTVKSYTSSLHVAGKYQEYLKVYKKENEPCKICHSKIIKIKIGGRSTYYCPKCQV